MASTDNRNHDQFLRCYVENEVALRGFVRSLVPTLEDAQEVMQETAAVLWKKFGELESTRYFRPWAFGVARYQALAFRRDRARDRHVFGDELIETLALEAEEAGAEISREERALQDCLTKLPGKQHVRTELLHVLRLDRRHVVSGLAPVGAGGRRISQAPNVPIKSGACRRAHSPMP